MPGANPGTHSVARRTASLSWLQNSLRRAATCSRPIWTSILARDTFDWSGFRAIGSAERPVIHDRVCRSSRRIRFAAFSLWLWEALPFLAHLQGLQLPLLATGQGVPESGGVRGED